jgi:hypothetical protein
MDAPEVRKRTGLTRLFISAWLFIPRKPGGKFPHGNS